MAPRVANGLNLGLSLIGEKAPSVDNRLGTQNSSCVSIDPVLKEPTRSLRAVDTFATNGARDNAGQGQALGNVCPSDESLRRGGGTRVHGEKDVT